nr:aspartyl/asparaginyl beta-hydroxylase domain-containing protein [Burkholderia sp. Ac-20384]
MPFNLQLRSTWKEGQVLAFDDSFEHEVWNKSSSSRAILLVDVWHPELSLAERTLLEPALKLLDDDYNASFTVENAVQDVERSFAQICHSGNGHDLVIGERQI